MAKESAKADFVPNDETSFEKECFSILLRAERVVDKPKKLIAFIGRLGDELAHFGDCCEERSCDECPVGQIRRGISGVSLSSREMVVNVVSTAIEGIVGMVSEGGNEEGGVETKPVQDS